MSLEPRHRWREAATVELSNRAPFDLPASSAKTGRQGRRLHRPHASRGGVHTERAARPTAHIEQWWSWDAALAADDLASEPPRPCWDGSTRCRRRRAARAPGQDDGTRASRSDATMVDA